MDVLLGMIELLDETFVGDLHCFVMGFNCEFLFFYDSNMPLQVFLFVAFRSKQLILYFLKLGFQVFLSIRLNVPGLLIVIDPLQKLNLFHQVLFLLFVTASFHF